MIPIMILFKIKVIAGIVAEKNVGLEFNKVVSKLHNVYLYIPAYFNYQ